MRFSHFGQDRGSPLYQKGSRGAEVKVLQQYLTRAGFDTKGIDGIFGNNTFNAVVAFQKTYNLPADGIVYQDTFEALANVVANYEAAGVVKLAPREAGTSVPDIQDTPLGVDYSWTTPTVAPTGETVIQGRRLPPLPMPGSLPFWKSIPTPVLVIGSLASLGVLVWALAPRKAAPRPAMAGYSRRKRRRK